MTPNEMARKLGLTRNEGKLAASCAREGIDLSMRDGELVALEGGHVLAELDGADGGDEDGPSPRAQAIAAEIEARKVQKRLGMNPNSPECKKARADSLAAALDDEDLAEEVTSMSDAELAADDGDDDMDDDTPIGGGDDDDIEEDDEEDPEDADEDDGDESCSQARLSRAIRLAVAGAAPPTEVRLFAMGKIATTKGVFLFDKVAGASVMAAWKSYGNDLCFDYEHKSVDENARAGDGKAAGWFQLELRADGLYAVNIKWTSQAAQQVAAREWRYYSPTFDFDRKTGRITELLNVALTNIPATKNLPALVAASADDANVGGQPLTPFAARIRDAFGSRR